MGVMIEESLTVLLIEDNPDDERLALRALRTCGLSLVVRVAHDGEQALKALGLDGSSEGGEDAVPNLVISDLKMPKLNGDEVLRRARADARLRDVPYVLFSSSDEAEDVRRCLDGGATAYCAKPVDFREYVDCAAMIARRYLSESDRGRDLFCMVEAPPKPSTSQREAR